MLQRVFVGNANTDGSPRKFVDVSLTVAADQTYRVEASFNADDNLFGNEYIRLGVEHEMRDAYKTLFTSGLPISSVTLSAYFPLRDRFGNVQAGLLYQTRLVRATADRVNWTNADQVDWPNVWTPLFILPDLRRS